MILSNSCLLAGSFASVVLLPVPDGKAVLFFCCLHYCLLVFAQILGKRGIMDLLGLRKTVGSAEKFPPSRKKLMASFQEKHKLVLLLV